MAAKSSMETPLLIIVSGPPASGKSTLGKQIAAGMGLPYFAKDDIKEELYDNLGKIERALSRKLGEASIRLLYIVARRVMDAGIGVVIEANFYRDVSEQDLSSMLPLDNALLIQCEAPQDELVARYEARDKDGERHPVHDDAGKAEDLADDLEQGIYEPLDLGIPIIRVQTSGDVDPSVAEIISQIRMGMSRTG